MPEYTEAELKDMDHFIKSAGGRAPKHQSTGVSAKEKARRRAKNKQRRASRKRNR